MKRLFILLLPIFSLFIFVAPLRAASVSPTQTIPSEDKAQTLNQKIDHLKTVLASKVAELRLVDKKGIIGTVQDVSSTQMTLTDRNGTNRLIDVDEITKFSSASANGSFGISDIKKGTKVSVLGLYNKESQRILARFVSSEVDPVMVSGVISAIDRASYTATITQEGGTSELVDIENLTKITSFNDALDGTKTGFSKMTTGVRATAIGYADPKEANRLTGSRILLFPSLPKNPKIHVQVNTETPTDTPPATPTKKAPTR